MNYMPPCRRVIGGRGVFGFGWMILLIATQSKILAQGFDLTLSQKVDGYVVNESVSVHIAIGSNHRAQCHEAYAIQLTSLY